MNLFVRIFDAPRTVLILTFLVLVGAVALIPGIRTETALEKMVTADNPILLDNQYLESIFGEEELLVISLELDDIFTLENLRKIYRVSEALRDVEHVEDVISLTHITLIYAEGDTIEVRPAFDREPATRQEAAALREKILGVRQLRRQLLSDDQTVTSINVGMTVPKTDDRLLDVVLNEIEDVVAQEFSRDVFALAGITALKRKMGSNITENFITFAPLCLLVIIVLTTVIFRVWYAVPIATLAFGTAMAVTLAAMRLTDNSINILTTMLPPLLLVIVTTICVHVLTDYAIKFREIQDKLPALRETIRHIGPPCLLTAVTTAIGFSSLAATEILTIQTFGLFTAFGVLLTFLFSITVAPVLLRYVPPLHYLADDGQETLFVRVLHRIARTVEGHPYAVIVVFATIIGTGLYGMTLIRAETHFLSYYYESDPFRVGFERIEEQLAGATTIEVLFESDAESGLIEPEAMAFVERVQRYGVDHFPEIAAASSYIDFLKEMQKNLDGSGEAAYVLPESRAAASQFLLLYSFADDNPTTSFLTQDYRKGRLNLRAKTVSTVRNEEIIADLEAFIDRTKPANLDVRLAGSGVLHANMANLLVEGQIKSFGVALVIISLAMVVVFRSIPVGVLAMLPNVTPIFMTFGLMGFLGVRLNTATAMIASVSIGIAVDDTIHYVSRFIHEFRKDGDYLGAMHRSVTTIGQPIVYTTVIIVCGFMVLALSDHLPFVYFGVLTSLTMIAALLADLFLLPALFITLKPPIPKGRSAFLEE